MSTASAYLTVRGIDVDVIYKDIKNLHIGVYPPLGRVRVAAPRPPRRRASPPRRHPASAVDQAAARAAPATPSASPQREMVTGESHYVWGVRRRLKVVERPGRPTSRSTASGCCCTSPTAQTPSGARELLERWYREQLRAAIPALIAKWEPTLGRVGAAVEHPADEDQVGIVQPRDRAHLVQRRARQEAPATAWSTSSSTR